MMARNANAVIQMLERGARELLKIRKTAANPMASAPVARKIVIVVGAPWYVSGTQRWKGTAAISKPNPAMRRMTPSVRAGLYMLGPGGRPERESEIMGRYVEPVTP